MASRSKSPLTGGYKAKLNGQPISSSQMFNVTPLAKGKRAKSPVKDIIGTLTRE